ncbi:MAG: nucleotidyl transferase AbiEii/AbiGii toxin family protein [Akkermansiaceae bacterium]|nr:nucleotidyl transferase AbiEii/AbiGii toxin family protein [Akkermansiaceae bacterium]
MDKLAQQSAEERRAYFQEAAAKLSLPPHVVEKDFWVCWTLKHLFVLECVRGNLLFKGGTSLSKVYGLIHRFSEDIDLSIHRASLGFEGDTDPANTELSNNARKRQNVALTLAARDLVQGDIREELEKLMHNLLGNAEYSLIPDETDPDGQSLAFFYPSTSITLGANSYLRPSVKIEFGARSDHWPSETRTLQPYLSEAIPDALEQAHVEVKSMKATRTFWEKATILHQMAHLPDGKSFPVRYSRHYSDLAAMIKAGIGEEAAGHDGLLQAVVDHKTSFYRSAWASYETANRGALRLIPTDDHLAELESDLGSMREMFFGVPPQLDDILTTLRNWETHFNQTIQREDTRH